MRAVLALDIGTTLGWALRRRSGRVESGRLTMRAGDHPGARMRQFRSWLADLSLRLESEGGIGAVAWEDAFRQPGNANAVHHRLVGVLLEWADRNQIPAEPVGISAIKKFATGKGTASKDDMLAAARALYPAVLDHNEADAIHVLRCAFSGALELQAAE